MRNIHNFVHHNLRLLRSLSPFLRSLLVARKVNGLVHNQPTHIIWIVVICFCIGLIEANLLFVFFSRVFKWMCNLSRTAAVMVWLLFWFDANSMILAYGNSWGKKPNSSKSVDWRFNILLCFDLCNVYRGHRIFMLPCAAKCACSILFSVAANALTFLCGKTWLKCWFDAPNQHFILFTWRPFLAMTLSTLSLCVCVWSQSLTLKQHFCSIADHS